MEKEWGFLDWLLRASGQAAVLIALIFVVRWLWGKKLSAAWRYNLWLLVLIKLLLPFNLETSWSIFNLGRSIFPNDVAASARSWPSRPERTDAAGLSIGPALSSSREQTGNVSPALAPKHRVPMPAVRSEERDLPNPLLHLIARPRLDWRRWFGIIWICGVVVLGIPLFYQSWKLRGEIGAKRQVTDSAVLNLLEDCKERSRVRSPLVAVQTPALSSPVLYGFIRPRLLLPQGLIETFSRAELGCIFLHELSHLKRQDILVNWVMTLLQLLHWFNPFVWFAFAQMRADRELACDHLALTGMSRFEIQRYGQTLIRLVETYSRPATLPAFVGLLEQQSLLRRRIAAIVGFEGTAKFPLWGLGITTALALVTLTDAQSSTGQTGWAGLFHVPQRLTSIANRTTDGFKPTGGSLDRLDHSGVLQNIGFEKRTRDTWELRSSPSRHFARMSYSAVWTGTEMIVWGGGANGYYFNDGARYAPDTDTWRPVSTNGAPAGRWFHAAVWTGREMIIWGGRSRFDIGLSNRTDGARYDPVTDQWTPMSELNAPAGRSQMAAVWTGTELMVWGGIGAGGTPALGGGRYNIAQDRWLPLPEEGSPEPRCEPAYVWTGKEMIVWGGVTYHAGQLSFGTGGRYNPSANRWAKVSLDGAHPSATGMQALWTGTEMLIWGGRNLPSDRFLDVGGRYDPELDTWTPMSTNGAPSPRALYTGVWTGKEMVVWGGWAASDPKNAEAIVNTGATYDPRTDQWFPMTPRAPEVRHFGRHDIGIWTGEGMLVFAGSNLKIELHSLYFWRPSPSGHRSQTGPF